MDKFFTAIIAPNGVLEKIKEQSVANIMDRWALSQQFVDWFTKKLSDSRLGFDTTLPFEGLGQVHVKWSVEDGSIGAAIISYKDEPVVIASFLPGTSPVAEQKYLKTIVEQGILSTLRGTANEGSNDLRNMEQRPLLASIIFFDQSATAPEMVAVGMVPLCMGAVFFAATVD